MKPSTAAVLSLLRSRGLDGVTQLEALEAVHTMRLAARVADLRAEGYRILSVLTVDPKGRRFSRYFLEEAPEQLVVGL